MHDLGAFNVGKFILLDTRVWHGAIVVNAIGRTFGQLVGGCVIDTAVGSQAAVGDKRGGIEVCWIESVDGGQASNKDALGQGAHS